MIQLQALNFILENKDVNFIYENNLNQEFFSDYRAEFEFINNHIQNYNKIPDKETFLATFSNFDIITVNETSKYILDELYKDRNSRSLARVFNKIRELLNDGKTDEAMNLYLSSTDNISQNVKLETFDLFKDTSRYDAYVEKCNDFTKYYIKTGFKELDDIIGGWDRQEELATIVARTNSGKTWMLLKTAVAAAEQGLTVGIYSGEMSERKIGYRIDTLISHISNKKLTHGDVEIQNEYKKFIDNLNQSMKGTIKVLTPAMISGPAGVNALRAFIEKDKLDMLCIDQHSLLEDDRKAKSPVEKAANISRDLKNLQVLKRIPIIAVSQQNRGSTENGLDTTLIAQSDRIGQDSTVVLFFERKESVMTLHLTKSRDSENNRDIQYALDFDKGIFTYIPTESDALGGQDCDQLRQEFEPNFTPGDDVF